MKLWKAPTSGAINSALSIPGSKSLTNRYLIVAALGTQPLRINAPLHARDTELMVEALRTLGLRVDDDGEAWIIYPATDGKNPAFSTGHIDAGLAGTVMRFIPGLAAHAQGVVTIDGDEAARVRPMGTVVNALRDLGVRIDAPELNGQPVLPLTIHGAGQLAGGVVEIDASASSQFVSALLLSAPLMKNGLDLHHIGARVPSTPHIRMTVELLREAGITVSQYDAAGNEVFEGPAVRWVVQPGRSQLTEVTVEADLSNAGPYMAAAMVTGGTVTIRNWPLKTTQPGDQLRNIFTAMGGHVSLAGTDPHVRDLTLHGPEELLSLDLDMADVGELVPTVAAVCAFASGTSYLRNIGQLRGHETNRLAALVTEFAKLGVEAAEVGDDLVITPRGELQSAVLASYEDHRMATFGAIIGLRVPGVEVENIETTAKTMPTFTKLWALMLGQGRP
ncbi:MAG: 3-phosphoshikimate 1-carboxyvinyltransferase [Actinomycetaceae bacterium]|nr:3-phosphoshikimate 1-carboxyvinyltransferase [Actinomycetaceae bacterium]